MAGVRLDDVGLTIGGAVVMHGLDLEVPDGALAAVIGPSGSGKTLLLRMIAGLIEPTAGRVSIGGTVVDARQPWRNRVAMVFQDDALYEHLTVASNLEFPWTVQGHDRDTARAEAERTAVRTGIGRLLGRMPGSLSEGQRGMVGASRALSRPDPSVVLLDEPLARADAAVRHKFRAEIRRLHSETGLTMVLATNDQAEAMSVATHLVVLIDGEVRQVGRPADVFRSPVDLAVARFVGQPAMNLIPARWSPDSAAPRLQIGDDLIAVGRPAPPGGRRVVVGLHPFELVPADSSTPFTRILHATAGRVEDLGSSKSVYFGLGRHPGAAYAITIDSDASCAPGDRLELTWAEASLRLFDAETGQTIPV